MSQNLPPENPQSERELLWYCKEYERNIFVRTITDQGWTNKCLAELTPQEWGRIMSLFLSRFEASQFVPIRLKEDLT